MLKSGAAGAALIKVRGKGALLPDPTLPISTLPVTVQLVNGEGTCWETTHGTTVRNDSSTFKSRAD